MNFFIEEIDNGNTIIAGLVIVATLLPVFLITYRNLKRYIEIFNRLVEEKATSPENAIKDEDAREYIESRISLNPRFSALHVTEKGKVWAQTNTMKWTVVRILLEVPLIVFLLSFLIVYVFTN